MAVSARLNENIQNRPSGIAPLNPGVNKRLEFLDPVQDTLKVHPVSFSLRDVCCRDFIFSEKERDALSPRSLSHLSFSVITFYPQILRRSLKSNMTDFGG
jgi:hypothetical protein